nr:myb-like protein X [Arachis hypogaea]
MKRRLEIMWGRFGGIDVIDLGNDFYLIKFYAQEDLDHALLDGPWKIYDHYLAVRLWEPNFNPLLTFIDKITAWIRLPGLPIELGKFARLCVEVDLTKPLLGVYMIKGKLYQIEYEGIHQLCFLCGRIDHEQKQCTLGKEIDLERGQHIQVRDENHKETSRQQAKGQNTRGMDAKEEEARRKEKDKETLQHTGNNFGPWMIVQKQRRSRREPTEEGNKNGEGTSKAAEKEKKNENLSRFKVLEVEETQQEEEELQQREEERDTNKQTTHKAAPQKNKGKNQMQQNQKKLKENNNNGTLTQNLPKQTTQSKGKAIGSYKAIKITQGKTSSHNQEGPVEETHRENWNETNDDTQSTELEEIQCTELNQNFMEEGRPPDPEKADRNQEDSMETEMQKEIENLIEGVDFETPSISEPKDNEAVDMQLQ